MRSVLFIVFLASANVTSSIAQTSTDQLTDRNRVTSSTTPTSEANRVQSNESTLLLLGGELGAANLQPAYDIAAIVNGTAQLRVLPVLGEGPIQNAKDVIQLRSIDLALTSTQALKHLRRTGEVGPAFDRQIAYIAPLFLEAFQIVAHQRHQTIQDLQGKRVSFSNNGSTTALFAPHVFKLLGIEVQELNMAQDVAIDKLRRGEIDATVCTCAAPIPAFGSIMPEWGMKLLDVPFAHELQDSYLPMVLSSEDYPALIGKDVKVQTIAALSLLITSNWPKTSSRYARTAKFVEALFSRFSDLQKPPRHPLWRSVNLAAAVPELTRFPAAQEWLDKHRADQLEGLKASFREFIATRSPKPAASDPTDTHRQFQEFLEWMSRNQR